MTNADLSFTPAWQLREWIASGQLSPMELTTHMLRRIDELNPKLNAFLTVCGDEAVAAAKQAEEQALRGEAMGPLHGIPVPIKDLSRTAGIRTTRGSLIYKDDVPTDDDMVVARIKAAGGIVVGKTNTPEFGHRGTTENLLGDPCPQSVGPTDDTGRLQWRLRGSGGVRNGVHRAGERRRRLDPRARQLLRGLWLQAIAGPRAEHLQRSGRLEHLWRGWSALARCP